MLVPWVTVYEVVVPPVTAKVMVSTAHVVNGVGILVTPAILAKICVRPGRDAVASAWSSDSPCTVLFTVTTCPFNDCHVNCPTLDVMSAP